MRLWVLLMLILGLLVSPALGGDIPSKVEKAIKAKNFPAYPGSEYCTGPINMGARFASSDPVDKVRKWYQGKLPDWSVMDQYGTWTLHEGAADASVAEVMTGKQITIMKNDALPSWHDLSPDTTTEIIGAFPD